MTLESWLLFGEFVLIASAYVGLFVSDSRLREANAMLVEVRRVNDEFAEALALAQYGAVDEAIDVARRWRQRREAPQPAAISRAIGGRVRRVAYFVRRGRA